MSVSRHGENPDEPSLVRKNQSGQPDRVRRVSPARRKPTVVDVNATMARLGIGVEWSEEAVRQLAGAAAALEAYLDSHPDQAQAVFDAPDSVLQSMIDQGLAAMPVDELRAAMAATRRQKRGAERNG